MPAFANPLSHLEYSQSWPARGVGFPSLPPQAPQSNADSNGLFSEVLPCAQNRTSRAKFPVNPIIRRAVSTVTTCSSWVHPARVIRSFCHDADRRLMRYCRRNVSTKVATCSFKIRS